VALANFTLADKLRTATQALLAPLSQALFPRMSHLFANDAPAAFSLLKRSALLVFIVAGSMSLMLWGLSNWLVNILAGPGFEQAAKVLQWIAFLPLLIGFSNLLGVQIMVPKKLNRPFNIILTTAGLTSLLIVWPLVTARQEIGAAQTFLITEGLVTASMMAFLWHRGHLSFRQKSNHDS
jgi:PST family polysaccharide transporter